MDIGDIGEPETAGGVHLRGTDRSIDTRPRRHANACHRADWSDVYELSKKLHREANSAAVRGTPILIGSPQRGQSSVASSNLAGLNTLAAHALNPTSSVKRTTF
jgi:hypothetical protein